MVQKSNQIEGKSNLIFLTSVPMKEMLNQMQMEAHSIQRKEFQQ